MTEDEIHMLKDIVTAFESVEYHMGRDQQEIIRLHLLAQVLQPAVHKARLYLQRIGWYGSGRGNPKE